MPDLRELRRLHFAEMLIEQNAGASPKPEQTTAYRAFRLQSDIGGQLIATALEREDSLDRPTVQGVA